MVSQPNEQIKRASTRLLQSQLFRSVMTPRPSTVVRYDDKSAMVTVMDLS